MPSIIERHRQARAEGRGVRRSEVDRLRADLDALRDTLVSRNVLDAADLPATPDRPQPRTGA